LLSFFLSRVKRNDGVVIAPEAVHSRNGTKGPKTFWKPQRDRKENKKKGGGDCLLFGVKLFFFFFHQLK
jgi:hypothetical protein